MNNEILKEVKNYVTKVGYIKIENVLFSEKDNKYIFFFEKTKKDGDDYQECIIADSKTGKTEVKNLLTLMTENQDYSTYEEITLAE